ncbi:unannotated protein [freshwater metagenome]|uniref:Unannotated protein n=1 Tax=freshwater metagenome TaxID=449393 RepID=A0A6J6E8K0_9ZZZZ
MPTILALPYLSAITPPNGAIIKKQAAVEPSAIPSKFAEPVGRANTPKAIAIGPRPFP